MGSARRRKYIRSSRRGPPSRDPEKRCSGDPTADRESARFAVRAGVVTFSTGEATILWLTRLVGGRVDRLGEDGAGRDHPAPTRPLRPVQSPFPKRSQMQRKAGAVAFLR